MPTRPSPGDSGVTSPLVLAALLVSVLGLVVGGAAVVATQSQPTGDEILERVNETYANAETVTGSATVTVTNGSATATSDVQFAAADPNQTRVVVSANGTTVQMGTNGTVAWVYDPATGALRVWDESDRDRLRAEAARECGWGQSDAEGPWDDADRERMLESERFADASLSWNESNVSATRTGTESVNGTEATVVRLEPADGSGSWSSTLWVSPDDWTVLKQRVTDGTNETVVVFEDVRFDVSVHESTFDPPTDDAADVTGYGVTEYDDLEALQSNTSMDLPVLNDSSYTFERAGVTTRGDETTAFQEYTDGSARVMLITSTGSASPDANASAQTVSVNGKDATVTTVRGQTAVWWQDGDRTHAVVADAPVDEVRTLAEAVEDPRDTD